MKHLFDSFVPNEVFEYTLRGENLINELLMKSFKILSVTTLFGVSALAQVSVVQNGGGVAVQNKTTSSYQAGGRVYTSTSVFPNYSAKITRTQSYNGQKFYEMLGLGDNVFVAPGGQNDLIKDWGNAWKSVPADVLLKEGVCNEPDAPCDAPAITIDDLKKLIADGSESNPYYNSAYRYKGGDLLGKRGGKYNANILDSYCGETQVQFAKPPANYSWTLSNTPVKFDENNGAKGPLIWMAFASMQEYYNMDAQVMMSSGMKESWLMTTGRGVMANVGLGELTPFHITEPTFQDQISQQFSQYYPFGLGYTRYLGGVSAADGVKTTEGELAVNGVFSSGILWRSYYEMLKKETDLGFRQLLEDSYTNGDPLIALCLMSSLYNQGPNQDGVHSLLLPSGELPKILGNRSACSYIQGLPGVGSFGNYLTELQSNAKALETASMNAEKDPTIALVDRWITWDELVTFWFGKNGAPSKPAKDQEGGLLLHYNLDQTTRQEIFDDIKTAFDLQSKHWPAQNGKPVISYRYDWLSNLRVVKNKLNRKISPVFPFFIQGIVDRFSKTGYSGDGQRIDKGFPFAKISNAQISGDFIFEVNAEDPLYVQGGTDSTMQDRGIAKVEWTSSPSWASWRTDGVADIGKSNPRLIGRDTGYLVRNFQVKIPAAEVQQLQSQGGAVIYVKVTDLCNNSVVISTPIAGVRLPKLTIAEMYDKNGDGFADSLYFNGVDDSIGFNTFKSGSYTWGTDGKQFQKSQVLGQFAIIDTSLARKNDDPTMGDLTLVFDGGQAKKAISDKVAPVILSASLQEKKTSDAKDTLILSFNRKVTGVDPNALAKFLDFFGTSMGLGAPESMPAFDGKSMTLIYPANSIKAFDPEQGTFTGDSVRIAIAGPLVASVNGLAAQANNQKVQIVLNKGPLLLKDGGDHAWIDQNGDGTMDLAQIQFARNVDAYRLKDMKVTLRWKKGAKGALFTKNFTDNQLSANGDLLQIKFASADSITPNLTYFDVVNSDSTKRWGTLSVSQPDRAKGADITFNVPMKDQMGPVVVKADLKRTNSPKVKPDYLDLIFSEPLDVAKSTGKNLFEFRHEGSDRALEHSSSLKWKSANTALQIAFPPELKEHPTVGDSVRFSVIDVTGLVVDPSGNRPHVANPLRPITGKPVLQVNAVAYAESKFADLALHQRAFDTLYAFDKNIDVDSIAKVMGLSGFYVRLTFNDIKDSSLANISSDSLVSLRNSFWFTLHADIYSNLGAWVVSYDEKIDCKKIQAAAFANDARLSSACDPRVFLSNREFSVFVPWNTRDANGRLAGTGVYLIKPKVSTSVGVSAEPDAPIKIGVVRNK